MEDLLTKPILNHPSSLSKNQEFSSSSSEEASEVDSREVYSSVPSIEDAVSDIDQSSELDSDTSSCCCCTHRTSDESSTPGEEQGGSTQEAKNAPQFMLVPINGDLDCRMFYEMVKPSKLAYCQEHCSHGTEMESPPRSVEFVSTASDSSLSPSPEDNQSSEVKEHVQSIDVEVSAKIGKVDAIIMKDSDELEAGASDAVGKIEGVEAGVPLDLEKPNEFESLTAGGIVENLPEQSNLTSNVNSGPEIDVTNGTRVMKRKLSVNNPEDSENVGPKKKSKKVAKGSGKQSRALESTNKENNPGTNAPSGSGISATANNGSSFRRIVGGPRIKTKADRTPKYSKKETPGPESPPKPSTRSLKGSNKI